MKNLPCQGLTCGVMALLLFSGARAEERAKCLGVDGYAQAANGARTFLWRPEWVSVSKRTLSTSPELAGLLKKRADRAMTQGPYSVTDKTSLPQSGDRSDYVSLAPYWWPDPMKPAGQPYIRRDGEINPERAADSFDMVRAQKMHDDVQTLALAYALMGERAYAERAALLLRVWFIDPKTRMNPNLTFAQSVPGQASGRGEGVIDALRFQAVVESIGLITPSGALSVSDQSALEQWFGQFADWMRTSPNGKAANAKTNNHGLYYDVMLAHFSMFARQQIKARSVLSEFALRRLAAQMNADGAFPQELERTRSFHYSVWTLDGALSAASLGDCLGVDLWHWTSSGRSLSRAAHYLTPYVTKRQSWPLDDLDLKDVKRRSVEEAAALPVLRRAAWGLADEALGLSIETRQFPLDLSDDLLTPAFLPSNQK